MAGYEGLCLEHTRLRGIDSSQKNIAVGNRVSAPVAKHKQCLERLPLDAARGEVELIRADDSIREVPNIVSHRELSSRSRQATESGATAKTRHPQPRQFADAAFEAMPGSRSSKVRKVSAASAKGRGNQRTSSISG